MEGRCGGLRVDLEEGQERLEASHRRAMWLTAQHGVWRRENEDLSFLEHMLDLYLTHKTAKLGKAHLKPTFGSLVSCVCSCVSALCASGTELSEKDALMIRVRPISRLYFVHHSH